MTATTTNKTVLEMKTGDNNYMGIINTLEAIEALPMVPDVLKGSSHSSSGPLLDPRTLRFPRSMRSTLANRAWLSSRMAQ